MVARFVLDTNALNDADFGLGGDSPAFVLNSSTLDGNGKLDGFTFSQNGTAAATLGGIAASASAIITKVASASAALGGLTAAATGAITISASGSASLGGASSSATGIVTHLGSGASSLGGLIAAAIGSVTPFGSMTAELGPMVATAVGTVTPQPAPAQTGGGRPVYRQTKRKKVQPVVVEEVVDEPTIKVVEAFVTPLFVGLTATARGSITFSGEDDDLQVMLML